MHGYLEETLNAVWNAFLAGGGLSLGLKLKNNYFFLISMTSIVIQK